MVIMSTQAYLTEMQTMNGTAVQQVSQMQQQQQQQQQQTTAPVQVQIGIGRNTVQKTVQAHSSLQPTQSNYSGQQFIVTIAGEQNGDHDNLQIQHGSGGQIIYQQQQQNYTDYNPQPSMYTSVSGTYYQQHTGGGTSSQMSSGVPGQIVAHGGDTFIVHQGGVIDGDGSSVPHTIRASPASVQWLMDNYETAEGVSLPRSTLYNHYLRHCNQNKLDPMNPASFGKLIRSVFLGLRTRRLGTRGNSQYHYYGIRIKTLSPLNQLTNDQMSGSKQHSINPGIKRRNPGGDMQDSSGSVTDSSPTSQTASSNVSSSQNQQHQQFLGDASTAIPEFGHVELSSDQLPDGLTLDDVMTFEEIYKDHCEAFLEIVINLQFALIETLWMSFWRNSQAEPEYNDMEQRLPKDKFYALCELPAIRQFMRRSDYAFYQALVHVLIPDVLRPIPSSLTQGIRNFAKSLEGWLKNAMAGAPDDMVKTKVGAISAFAQILRRYTSLNHLAQAARAVLQNSAQISQMLADINKVDFVNVQEQASWVCQCDDNLVTQLEQDFKRTLQHQTSLEQWAAWLEDVVNQALSSHESSHNFPKAARQFLLKWSFYSSMVIRDLTLRSAASFGSFHLIRLLYDEYMFYLVEHKVATALGETSIAVMGEVRQSMDIGSMTPLGAMPGNDVAQLGFVSSGASNVRSAMPDAYHHQPLKPSTNHAAPSTASQVIHNITHYPEPVKSHPAPGITPSHRVALISTNAQPSSKTIIVMPGGASSTISTVDGQLIAKRVRLE